MSIKIMNYRNKIRECLPEKMFLADTWSMLIKRLIYITGFVGLCMIDQMVGSATGYIQYSYRNYSGIIIGVFILTAYAIKDFFKIPYLIWGLFFLMYRNGALVWLQSIFYNGQEVETNLWGIGLYGIILIRMFYLYIIEKKKPKVNWIFFGVGILMYVGMVLIRSDYSWTFAVLGAYLCFYLTEFKEKDLNNFFSGMLEGIIIGFLIIQIQAWQYRPYDTVRYKGMYSHANINALMYLCAYCATLCKWYLMKLKKQFVVFRIPFIMLAGLIIATMFYTGGRAAFITAIVLTAIFLGFQMISRKRWGIIELLVDGVLLVVSIGVCVMPAYWLIRYVPVYVNEPLYFETDYGVNGNGLALKIQKNDPINSEKYVEFDEATEEMFERYLWFLDDETQIKVEQWIRDLPEKLKLSLQAEAAEADAIEEVEIEPGSDKAHPLVLRENQDGAYDVRLDIFDYFLNKLPLIGEKNNIQGVWIYKWYFATHCHNLFIQIAYDFGLIIGFWFIGVCMLFYVCVLIALIRRRSGPWYFRLCVTTMFMTLFLVFGMLEIDWTYGQLAFTMFFICQYMVYHQDIFYRDKPKKVKVKEKSVEVTELVSEDTELEIIVLSDSEDSVLGVEEAEDMVGSAEREFEEL